MTPADLLAAWTSLEPPDSGNLTAREVVPSVWVAVDAADQQHLLVEVPGDTEAPPTVTHGLQVAVARHRVLGRDPAVYVDLQCLDRAVLQTFAAVTADVIAHLRDAIPSASRAHMVVEALNKWQWFWDVDPDRLSDNDAVGLFGELWFLIQWVGVTPEAVRAWQASATSRHDFQWRALSVEVKTTAQRRHGATVHHVQNLDQLADPEVGDLLLFSLRVTQDVLARNTLGSLVAHVLDRLPSPPDRDDFLRKLSRRGYTPALSQRAAVAYRVQEEELYRVDATFPRITIASFASELPAAVGDISYVLDMSACRPWLIASAPSQWSNSSA